MFELSEIVRSTGGCLVEINSAQSCSRAEILNSVKFLQKIVKYVTLSIILALISSIQKLILFFFSEEPHKVATNKQSVSEIGDFMGYSTRNKRRHDQSTPISMGTPSK